jgi:hypothetical protein
VLDAGHERLEGDLAECLRASGHAEVADDQGGEAM